MTKKENLGFEITELDGNVRNIRNPITKKIEKEVCIGKTKYRKNNVYGTYNSITQNKILRYNEVRKIRKCK